jgi:vacuolar-type H+-ATPase subunit E/Vma4
MRNQGGLQEQEKEGGVENQETEGEDQNMEVCREQRERKFGAQTNAVPRQGLVPSRLENAVDSYVEAVKEDIVKGLKKKPKDNLDVKMRTALSDIKEKVKKGEWAVRPADKGEGLTVDKKQTLVEDGKNELRITSTYKDMEGSQVQNTAERVKAKLQEMFDKAVISRKLYFGLQNRHPKAGTLKVNQKIHKDKNENDRYLWRAYVSGIGTATEGIAGLVEWELAGVRAQSSFVEDSSYLLGRLKRW